MYSRKSLVFVYLLCRHVFNTQFLCDFRNPTKDPQLPSVVRQVPDCENVILRLKYRITSSRFITPRQWFLVQLPLRSGVEEWMMTQQRKEQWPKHLMLIGASHLNLRVSTYTWKHKYKQYTHQHTHVQNNRRLISVRYCPCSSPVNDNPQGTVIIIRLGAIIYGSTSCPLSSSQTGFTILSYTISDLSLCSSDRLSVWPFYHLNGKDSFKKSPMGVLREEEDQVAINLTSLGTWAM